MKFSKIAASAALVVIGLILCASVALAATFTWDPSEGAAGYKLHCGTATGTYTQTVDVGAVTIASLKLAPGARYYCAATAYAPGVPDSAYSNEVDFLVPLSPPTNFRVTITVSVSPDGEIVATVKGNIPINKQ